MKDLTRSNLAHMAGGFALMGSWAVLANWGYEMPAPLVAGLTQGTMTAFITLGLKRMAESLSAGFPGRSGLLIVPIVACAISVTLLYTIHNLAATPRPWATLAVPSTVATIYSAIYAFRIRRDP